MSTAPPPDLRTLARVLGPELWALRGRFALAYGVTLVAVGAAALAPWGVKMMVDFLVDGPAAIDARWAFGWLDGRTPVAVVLGLTALLLVVSVIGALAEAGDGLVTARIKERLSCRVRDRMLAHLQTLSPVIRTSHRSGELVLRLVGDVDHVTRLVTKTLPLVVRYAATAVVTIGGVLWLSPRAGLVVVCALPWLVWVVRRYGARMATLARRRRRKEGDVAALAQEIVRGLPIVQALGANDLVRARFAAVSADSQKTSLEASRAAARFERRFELLRGLAMTLVTGGGALSVLQGHTTVGELTVLVAYVAQLLRPVDKLNDVTEAVSRGVTAAERLAAFLLQPPAVVESPAAIELDCAAGRLVCDDVQFAYASGTSGRGLVLRGVTAAFEPGELAVVIGQSGAGKSTLLSLFLRLFDPTAGEIRLDGRPLREISLRSLRAQFAVMTQDLHLFSGSIRSVLTMGAEPGGDLALWDALRHVALGDFVRSLPRGLDTLLGEDGVNLSGGQRQRLSLARAFLLDRPVLLLDEPLANVDAVSAAAILTALDRLRVGRTCIAITHEASLVTRADVVYRLEHGVLVPVPSRRSLLEVVR